MYLIRTGEGRARFSTSINEVIRSHDSLSQRLARIDHSRVRALSLSLIHIHANHTIATFASPASRTRERMSDGTLRQVITFRLIINSNFHRYQLHPFRTAWLYSCLSTSVTKATD